MMHIIFWKLRMGYFEEIYTLEDIVVFKEIFLVKRIFTFFLSHLKKPMYI